MCSQLDVVMDVVVMCSNRSIFGIEFDRTLTIDSISFTHRKFLLFIIIYLDDLIFKLSHSNIVFIIITS